MCAIETSLGSPAAGLRARRLARMCNALKFANSDTHLTHTVLLQEPHSGK